MLTRKQKSEIGWEQTSERERERETGSGNLVRQVCS